MDRSLPATTSLLWMGGPSSAVTHPSSQVPSPLVKKWAARRGHPCLWVIRCSGHMPPAPASARGPSIPSTESAREQNPGDDLFHEPEAQPNFVTAGVPSRGPRYVATTRLSGHQ